MRRREDEKKKRGGEERRRRREKEKMRRWGWIGNRESTDVFEELLGHVRDAFDGGAHDRD